MSATQSQLVIFDLDGTLIDSVPDLAFALDQTLESLSLEPVGEQKCRIWVGNGAASLVESALSYSLKSKGSNVRLAVKQYQPRAMETFFKYYTESCSQKTRLYPSVLETLEALKKKDVCMAIVTNKPKKFVAPILQSLNIEHYFSMIVGGDELAEKKPHPMPLLHCMDGLGFKADKTLMVGDSKHDVRAAQSADVLVAAVNYGYNHGCPIEDEKPDFVISNLYQILSDVLDSHSFVHKLM